MPIHGLASLLSSSSSATNGGDGFSIPIRLPGTSWHALLTTTHLAVIAIIAIGLWWIKKRWVNGKKCGWERDWTGKMVWIVGRPTPLSLELIDTLLRLPHPPHILYLPPLEAPLPSKLVTLLHAMNHAATSLQLSKSGAEEGLPKISSGDEQGGLPLPTSGSASGAGGGGWTTDAQGRAVREKRSKKEASGVQGGGDGIPLLTCEPLPEDADVIHEFVKRWLTGGAPEQEVESKTSDSSSAPAAAAAAASGVLQPEALRRKAQARAIDAIVWTDDWEVKRPWAPFAFRNDVSSPDESESAAAAWSTQEARHHLLTALIPLLLKSPTDRSVRLISLVSPFYAAAMAAERSLAEHRKKNDAAAEAGSAEGPVDAAALPKNESEDEQAIESSPVLESGRRGLRTAVVWRHLQKILDAVATATAHAQGSQAGLPPKVDEAGVAEVSENIEKLKRIELPSHIKALPVVVSLHRWGIVRSLLGIRGDYPLRSMRGWILYLLLSPMIYLLTPSTSACLQSVLHALSAPASKRSSGSLASAADAAKEQDGLLQGGKLVRDCEGGDLPMSPAEAEQRGQAIWDELQARVEKVVETLVKADKQGTSKIKGQAVRFQEDEMYGHEVEGQKESQSDASDDDDDQYDEPDVYA